MRLIDADALLDNVDALCEDVYCFICDLYRPRKQECRVATWINSAPTIDAVRHGEWIAYHGDNPEWQRSDGSPVFMSCSECDAMVVNNCAFEWNYCPNCGAKMDGGER